MTREEAIEQIKWYFEEDDGISAEDITKEAVYMAIEALTYQSLSKPNNTCEVDVIRCKDCKHMKYAIDKAKNGMCGVHSALIIMNGNDYCSYGERKCDDDVI